MRRPASLVITLLFLALAANAQQLTVASFNVESGEATTSRLRQDIRRVPASDVWGFSEVLNDSWGAAFETELSSTGTNYDRILGTTGGDDRLLIVYNAARLERIRHFELLDIGTGGRAPLVAHLRFRDGGQEFLFMVNHLNRGNAARRHEQATLLNNWAMTQPLPVIAVGDYNFDWNLPNGDANHDLGYDNLTRGDVFRWVRPATLIKTQCDPNFNSVLDFVFVTGAAKAWPATSVIQFPETSYCQDDNQRSDHRAVHAAFTLAAARPDDFRARLLERIEALERELRELKRMVEERP